MSVSAKHRIEAKLGTTADQVADMEEGDLTDFDAVTPAWDKEVDAVADFDSETDVDGDLNDAADAAHDGAVGLEITFDNNTRAYGVMNASAINQTNGIVSLWFDPNTFGLEDGKLMTLHNFRDGADAEQWGVQIKNNAGTYQVRVFAISDAAATPSTSYYDLVDSYNKIVFAFSRATAPGANDGWIMLFIDDVLKQRMTGLDNDTKDWDSTRTGMAYTNSTAFGGSFTFDTIKIDTIGAPMADKLAAQNGSYGMAIPIMDTTARYVTFTDPTAETRVSVECNFDPNLLTMSNGDTFIILLGQGSSVGGTTWNFYVRIKYLTATGYELQGASYNDAGTSTVFDSPFFITDASHHIRFVWVTASAVGANDGYCLLYVDDALEGEFTGLDNDQRDTGNIYFGARSGLDAGTYGIIRFDDCRWGPWVDITSDVIGDIKGYWGMMDNDPATFLADSGEMKFAMNNSGGEYIPGLTGSLSGWDKGTPVRLVFSYGGSSYRRFYGTIDDIDPDIKGYPGSEGDIVMVTVTDWLDYAATHPMLVPAIQSDKRGDEMLTTILADMPIQPITTDFDTGVNTFPVAFDDAKFKTKAYSEMSKVGVSELGPIYLIKDSVYGETLVFENAEARNGLRTSDATFDNSMTKLDVDYGENVINRFANKAYPRETAGSAEVLFSLSYPMVIASGETVEFRANYADPSGGKEIAGSSMIAPVITTDYLVNTKSDGSGTNISADLTITATYYSTSVKYTLANGSINVGYITKLQARGYKVSKYNPIEGAIEDSDSIDNYDYIEKFLNQKYQQELARGTAYGATIVEFEHQPRLKINKAHFVANRSAALMDAWLTRDVGDLVYLKEDKTETDKYVYIVGVAFTITPGGLVKYSWIVKGMLSLLLGLSLISCEFDATTGTTLDFGYLPQISSDAVTERTYSTWVYLHEYPATEPDDMMIASTMSGGKGVNFYIDYDAGYAATDIVVAFYTARFDLGQGKWITPANQFALNTWVNLIVSYEPTDVSAVPIIYIGGISQVLTEVGTPLGSVISAVGRQFTLGGTRHPDGSYIETFDGLIKDVRVYDVILTQAEATSLAAGGNVTRGMVFQAPCVKTSELSDFEDLTLTTSDKMIDNMYGMIGTPNNSVITRLIP